jgi:adenylate cyclase class IV
MNKEIEARFINLSQEVIEEKLIQAEATRSAEYFFREWIYDYPRWRKDNRRIRIRTDGKTTWLTYKANKTWEVDSTEEAEVIVSSVEGIQKIIVAIGIPLLRYQEKKRIRYVLGDTFFDLDFWPQIPMVLEIEAPSPEKVRQGARLLELDWEKAIFVDQKVLHNDYYGIDLNAVVDYRFNA